MQKYDYHIPVMLDECIDALNIVENGLYFDGTLGGGGHSGAILQRGGRIISTDRDSNAIDHNIQKFSQNPDYNGRFTLVKDNFKNVLQILKDKNITELDGAILDLGISSHQIDSIERGFSYMNDAVLDMRMDRDEFLSALTVVNEYSEAELSRIIFTYGEDKFARRIAAKIVEKRRITQIETTAQLASIIESAVPKGLKGGHPAKKTFQAIRIEVNKELSGLGECITDIVSVLKKGARLLVISFHSLEDRIIKRTFASLSAGCICDKSLPMCVCNHKPEVKLITKGKKPTDTEQEENKRSRSAILRVAEKL